MNISIVIPLYNEDESLRELHAWIHKVCEAHSLTYEVIFIDDGVIVEENAPETFFTNPKTERAKQFLQAFTFERRHS